MEVTVRGLQGIENGSIVSVRAGATRRQASAPMDQPLLFPILPINAGCLKVDVLRPLGSSRVNVLPNVEEAYPIVFQAADNIAAMSLELLIREAPHMCGVHASSMDGRGLEQKAAAEGSARTYLERWRLMDIVREMMQYIIREKPEDPYVWMASHLQRTSAATQAQTAAPAPAPGVPEVNAAAFDQDGLRNTIARQNARLDAENDRLRDEIEKLRKFCEEKGLPPLEEPSQDLLGNATLPPLEETLASPGEELSGRNRQLRLEHLELRRTLDGFCRGFAALATRLNAAVASTQQPVVDPVQAAETEAAAVNARLEEENRALNQQIEELAAGAPPVS